MFKHIVVLICFCVGTMGFTCMGSSNTFTMKSFSSIPPVVRWTTFTSDCSVTILDPPNTGKPFTYTMSRATCDSLERLCAKYELWDTAYVPTVFIPNPSSIDLEFTRDGKRRTVHIAQSPALPESLQDLISYASRIEYQGLKQMDVR